MSDIVKRLAGNFDRALDALAKAKPFAKSSYQTEVFQLAETLMGSQEGLITLYERAHRFDEAGVFHGGPWVDPQKLLPPLVAGSLKAGGVYPIVETLSELRMLSIAKGRGGDETMQADAREFLAEAMALNLEFLFPGDTEAERMEGGPHRDSNVRLFRLMADEMGVDSLRDDVVEEIEQIAAQRPIQTHRLRLMIRMASRIPLSESPAEKRPQDARLRRFLEAVEGASRVSTEHRALSDYREAIKKCGRDTLEEESDSFAKAMSETGLTSPHHAILLRHLRGQAPELLARALGLQDRGEAELDHNIDFVKQLIRFAILPSTCQSIYGLAQTLEFGLLSRQEVSAGLGRLVDLDLQSDVRRNLLARRETRDGVTANALLVAGVLALLGQPLGVGQGRNPTCQAARAISLWAQHAHGYLLETIISAARDGFVQSNFESEVLRTDELVGGVAAGVIDFDLDPVSIVLTPHLDVLYDAMMKRVVLRPEDGHKWVNPALYGRWVSTGFASVFADRAQSMIVDYDEFLRRFFATHHPAYNEGHELMYPNPVGILVTNSHGDYLGPHAVSLLRVAEDPQGTLRAYFFNPNNEGRQDWGHGVNPSVWGHGEQEGESSLSFDDFAARLYAFHYNPYEEGDAYAVPTAVLDDIEQAARDSWGRAFLWRESAA